MSKSYIKAADLLLNSVIEIPIDLLKKCLGDQETIDGLTRYLVPQLIIVNYLSFDLLSDCNLDDIKKIALEGDL